MTRVRLALFVLTLGVLACGQIVPTSTPTAPAALIPSATTSPPPSPTAEAIVTSDAAQIAEVVVPVVNVRQSPGGEVVGQLAQGETVTILLCDGEWCKIEYDQTTGYIFAGCLSVNPQGLGCSAR